MHALRALALVAPLLWSCAGPGATTHHEQRRAWERSAPAPASDDPFAGHATLERGALVAAVLARNPSIAAARWAWGAALARYPQEISLDDPMLDVGVGPDSFGSATDPAWLVELRQPLPFPGKRGLRGDVALAEAEMSRRERDVLRLELAVRAHALFAEYYLAARALEINDAHLRLLDELHQSALAQYQAGLVSQQDPLQAETERLELVHREIELRARLRTRAHQLNALLHRPAERPLPPPPERLPHDPLADAAVAESFERALATRPELAAADAKIAAGENALALARREFLPDFELWGRYDRFWSERELRPSVGLALNLPFQLDRRRGAVEQAEAELERARRERERLEDEIRAEVADASERVREQQHLEELLEMQSLPTARDRVVAAHAAYDTGQTTFPAVIDAFRARLQAELAYETALATFARRRAELLGATGDIATLESGGRP